MFDFGMPQLDPSMQQPLAAPLNIPTPKKKGGLFGSGSGNIGEAISAALLGALASRGNNPTAQLGLQMLHQRRNDARQRELEEAQYQSRRKDAVSDYAEKQKIEALYGKPAQPHYFEDNSGNQWAIGADGQPRMVHKDDLPFKLVPNGMGGVVPVDLRTLMGSQQQPPQTLSDEDWPTQGGPTPQASGGFPGSGQY